ncbi:MAG: serine--tRNA ligase [Patescibacteria group bacterium]|nr:serine--tRNA ligase [Patescibacteria group bacterium]
MLDIQFIRDNPELVAEKSKQKGYPVDIPQLLELDVERRTRLTQIDELRARRNTLASELKQGKPSDEQIAAGRHMKEEVATFEADLKLIDEKYQRQMQGIPNLIQDDVPIGGEELSVEVGAYGDQTTGAEDHLDYMAKRDWVDFERGTKVAGTKFYFLKGDLALLENAITQFALNFVLQKGFTYMTVPNMVNSRIATGTGFAPRSSEQSDEYFLEGEDLSLIATAEMPLTGYHADEIIEEKDLPLLYVGYSPCYRKEAGTYGKHTRGLFRVHQFNKLEMYAFVVPEASNKMHERIRAIEEELWQAIDIPYHVINIASGDLGAPAAKKYDLEYWSKVDGNYRELTSCSNCTDFQARNLNIRVRRQDGTIEILHTLNGTAAALARSLIAIVEHNQQENGKLRIPEVLRPYMGDRSEI